MTACPICGDPAPFCLWIDEEPPPGCINDRQAMKTGIRTINNVTECSYQMRKAEQRAHWRKAMPEAFDQNGNILPGMIGHVLERCMRPGEALVI